MKKTQYTFLIALSTVFYILTGCKSDPPAVPVADRIKNSYVASSVQEGTTTVYTAGGTSNIKNYSQFRLNLSNPPAVTYTAFDGTVFTGTYTVVGDNQIVLSGLKNGAGIEPTSTNGTITFTISELADGTVTLTRTTPDVKTGNTTNVYKLKKG